MGTDKSPCTHFASEMMRHVPVVRMNCSHRFGGNIAISIKYIVTQGWNNLWGSRNEDAVRGVIYCTSDWQTTEAAQTDRAVLSKQVFRMLAAAVLSCFHDRKKRYKSAVVVVFYADQVAPLQAFLDHVIAKADPAPPSGFCVKVATPRVCKGGTWDCAMICGHAGKLRQQGYHGDNMRNPRMMNVALSRGRKELLLFVEDLESDYRGEMWGRIKGTVKWFVPDSATRCLQLVGDFISAHKDLGVEPGTQFNVSVVVVAQRIQISAAQ